MPVELEVAHVALAKIELHVSLSRSDARPLEHRRRGKTLPMRKVDDEFMAEALTEARRSLDVDEFSVGAVVALGDDIVVRAHGTGAAQRRLLDHAEMLALRAREATAERPALARYPPTQMGSAQTNARFAH